MYTKILKPEIMSTMLPEGFPADKLSQPAVQDGGREGRLRHHAGRRAGRVDVFRPDAPGRFPALYATCAYQKDLAYLPQWPAFHFRETNDIEWFVSRGYVYVTTTSAGPASRSRASASSSARTSRTTSTT